MTEFGALTVSAKFTKITSAPVDV